MKYVVAIVITMAGLNAFIMWCMCVAAGKEDRQMEEMLKRRKEVIISMLESHLFRASEPLLYMVF